MFNSLAKKDIDLLQAYNRKTAPSPYETWIKAALPPLCIALVYTGVFAWQKVNTASNQNEIEKIQKEVTKYKKMASDLGDKEYNEYQEYQNLNGEVETIIKTLNSYPILNSSIINTFYNVAVDGTGISSIGYNTGVFTISLQTPYVLNVEKYVTNIKASGLFDEVQYTGYQQSEKAQDSIKDVETEEEEKTPIVTIKEYNFQIICTMKGGN